jgi:lipid kinase YegS
MTANPAPVKRRLALFLNARAAADGELREAVERVRERGHEVDVRALWEPGEARRCAADAARRGFDVAVAAGGDGTLNEVADGVLGAQGTTAVALLPYGTANDFATACGLTELPVLDGLRLASEGTPVRIDAGRANDRHFLNSASGGFGAEVTASTSPALKSLLGGLAYTLTGVVKFLTAEERQLRIRSPAGDWSGQHLLFSVGNNRLAGGGYRVAPKARLDDGLLDLIVVPETGLTEVPALIDDLFEDRTINFNHIRHAQVPWVEVACGHEIQVNLDGEPIAGRAFRFEVLPGALPFFLPVAAAELHTGVGTGG